MLIVIFLHVSVCNVLEHPCKLDDVVAVGLCCVCNGGMWERMNVETKLLPTIIAITTFVSTIVYPLLYLFDIAITFAIHDRTR